VRDRARCSIDLSNTSGVKTDFRKLHEIQVRGYELDAQRWFPREWAAYQADQRIKNNSSETEPSERKK
jgi:hypothetical protein